MSQTSTVQGDRRGPTRSVRLAALILLAVSATACGPGDGDAEAAAPSTAPGASVGAPPPSVAPSVAPAADSSTGRVGPETKACDLTTPEAVSRILGVAVLEKPEPSNPASELCYYASASDRSAVVDHASVFVLYASRVPDPGLPGGTMAGYFEKQRKDPAVAASDEVAGIGDGAFYSEGAKSWYARSGDQLVTVMVVSGGELDKDKGLALLRSAFGAG